MTIQEKQKALVDDFAFLEDWEQKYEYIIDLGKELKGLSEDKKTDENLIRGVNQKYGLMLNLRMVNYSFRQILTEYFLKVL